MKFWITRTVLETPKGHTQPRIIKTGIWIDNSEYPAAKQRELRKARGVGRRRKPSFIELMEVAA